MKQSFPSHLNLTSSSEWRKNHGNYRHPYNKLYIYKKKMKKKLYKHKKCLKGRVEKKI